MSFSGLVLVTDAISAMGLEEGTHNIGQYTIEIRDQKAYIAGTNTLCGSIATMTECVKHFKEATGNLKVDCTLLLFLCAVKPGYYKPA